MHTSSRYPGLAVVAMMVCLFGAVGPEGAFGGESVPLLRPETILVSIGQLAVSVGTQERGWGEEERGQDALATVVINELHTNPDVKTELVEFVELTNSGTAEVDLSGWQFTEGVFYTFPAGTKLPAGGYRHRGAEPGPGQGQVAPSGSGCPTVSCSGPTAAGWMATASGSSCAMRRAGWSDEVEYQLGFPWPTVGDAVPETQPGTGPSLQLVNPRSTTTWAAVGGRRCRRRRRRTGCLAENLPPQVRQVKHSPTQPKSGEVVTITAKVTDADGVTERQLAYQVVNAGGVYRAVRPAVQHGVDRRGHARRRARRRCAGGGRRLHRADPGGRADAPPPGSLPDRGDGRPRRQRRRCRTPTTRSRTSPISSTTASRPGAGPCSPASRPSSSFPPR